MPNEHFNLSNEFLESVANSKLLATRPDNDTLLQLYALYKQATEGDAPEKGTYGMFDIKEKLKHEAWLKHKGISSEEAQAQYISLVNQLSNNNTI